MMRSLFEDFTRDSAYGLRLLRRSPAFAAVALTTLAVGIGATVTMFSIVDAWLLKPLAFPDADRIVVGLAATQERPTEPAVFLPYRSYLAWKVRSRSFDAVSATFRRSYLIGGRGEATTAMGQVVSAEFFQVMGVPPEAGRTLTAGDAGGPGVVVISHGFWQRHFGGSTSAVGDHLTLNGRPHEIVGVMPPEFDVRMLDQGRGFELWTLFKPGEAGYVPDGGGPIAIVGRLRAGVSVAAAQAELSAVHRDVESAFPENFSKFVVHLTSLQSDNTRTVRATLVTLSGAVACLLLVACMNVGALLVGRGLARTREAAIRAAIGSGGGRLVRQSLTESLVISAIGSGAGIVLALIAIRLFAIWNPLGMLPSATIRIDLRTVTFAALVMAVTTVVSGLVPALRVGATDPNDALRSGGDRGSTGGRAQRAQLTLLAAQLAVSVVLLVAATLLARTLLRLQHEPLGFDASNLTVASVALPIDQFASSETRNVFVGQLSEAIGGMPGVERVAASTSPPLSSGPPLSVRTTADDSTPALRISAQDVSTDFFDALAIPLVSGRPFDARDSAAALPVTVLNESAARTIFGSPAAAIGRRIRLGSASTPAWREVVGVVRNTRSSFYNTLEWVTNPVIYLPAPQAFGAIRDPTVSSFGVHLYIRAVRPLPMLEIKRVVSALNERVAVTEVETASSAVATVTKQPAFRTALLGWFAVVSLALAAIGTYGLVVQSVVQRMRELGIRLALGANPRQLPWVVARRALGASVAGLIGGAIAATMLANAMKGLLYGVVATDAWSLVSAGATLLGVTAVTAFAAGARATRINPVDVLRAE
jgi:predicted permease